MSIVFIEATCEACGGTFTKRSNAYSKKRCDACQKAHRAAEKREWAKTEKGKACARRARIAAYYRNREKDIERNRAWKAANRERVRDYNRKWFRTHHQHALEWQRAYGKSEAGMRSRAKTREKRLQNLELHRARCRSYYWRDHDRTLLLERLRHRIRKGDMLAKLEHAKILGRIKRCDRLHLSALKLPCGQYPSCHKCPQDQRRCG